MKGKFKDLSGLTFGRLTVEGYMGDKRWWCNCSCGGTAIVLSQHLKSGHTKSCGCLNNESRHKTKNVKHGFWNTKYDEGTMKFYKMWQSLKARCDNPNLKCYKNYGDRGITYDSRWKDFESFKEDMYFKYIYSIKQSKLQNPSIERRDVNGNYCFENCTFVERTDQLKNLRSTHLFVAISPDGKEIIVKNANQFAKSNGLSSSPIYRCLHGEAEVYRGWKFRSLKN